MSDGSRLLGGRYRLGEVIGRGGMALVSEARDERLGRDVAVKELRIDLAGDGTFQERFRREAQAAAGLNHPNIVSVYDTGEEMDDRSGVHVPYIVMELLHGRTLRDILREGRPILPRRALEFAVGVLEALDYSHRAGIVHRDIKPANVMLTNAGRIKVMDFGIARAVSDTSSTMTQTAAVIGTAQYLSPEQARGEVVDARSDIYSAGCLLYELLVGRPPFTGDSPVSVAYQHVREAPVAPSQLDAEISTAMDAVVLKALAKDPDDRYATAGEMRDDIQRILNGERVQATLPPPLPPAQAPAPVGATAVDAPLTTTMDQTLSTGSMAVVEQPRRSRAPLYWTIALLSLLLVGLVGGFLVLNRPVEPKDTVTVPNGLLGSPRLIAETSVKDAGLTPVVREVERANDDTKGRVVEVDPKSGSVLARGTQVVLTVNVGPKQLVIPAGLVGMPEEQAKKALTDAGFTNVRSADAQNEPADAVAGTVVAVAPAVGSAVSGQETVTLSIASGKAKLPNLVGMTKEQALAQATGAGFTKVRFEEQATTPDNVGRVLSTNPQWGTLVAKTADVVVVIGKPTPKPTPTPTPTPTPSATPTPTATPSATAAPSPTPTSTP